MKKIKNWFIWKLFGSVVGVSFLFFFGFIFLIAYFSEKKKNNSDVQVMKENVLYIRPTGFIEKQPSDTLELIFDEIVLK